jgi:hypothetical protein
VHNKEAITVFVAVNYTGNLKLFLPHNYQGLHGRGNYAISTAVNGKKNA